MAHLSKSDYEALAAFRYAIRRFLKFSEAAARAAGVTAQQHQLLLALKGFPGRDWATISELTERLGAGQTSVTNLVGRMEAAGLVARRSDQTDRRSVSVHATERGEEILSGLSREHLSELQRLRDELMETGSRAWPVPLGEDAANAPTLDPASPQD